MTAGADKEFQDRFTNGLIKLMIESAMVEGDDGQRTAMIPAGEVIDTMLTTMAMLLSTSEATASPTKTRATVDDLARRLRMRIGEAKNCPMPFETYRPWEAN